MACSCKNSGSLGMNADTIMLTRYRQCYCKRLLFEQLTKSCRKQKDTQNYKVIFIHKQSRYAICDATRQRTLKGNEKLSTAEYLFKKLSTLL